MKRSLHPPALDDEDEIPACVLLEYKAYVAAVRNDTSAVAYSRSRSPCSPPGRGRFVIHVYNSKLNTWTVIKVSACLTRDIAVVNGHFKFILHQLQWKNCDCPTCCRDEYIDDGWTAAIWTRPVSAPARSLLDDSWQPASSDMESSGMEDVKSCPDFELLPKLVANEPFLMLDVSHPTLVSHIDGTVCFMVKINHGDAL